jgi:glycerophosphoryl diester phosphodiesterase
VHSYLAQLAFVPSWEFTQVFDLSPDSLVPWPVLQDWIPTRVNEWLDRLRQEIPPHRYRYLRVGHRGARAHAPDNTLASFRQAANLGADMVELDVQRTADGQIAVVHDAWLRNGDGHILPIRESTLTQLQSVDLGQGERISTLTEVLDLCEQEQMGAYIEIKDGGIVPSLVQTLLNRGWLDRCLIGSFRPDWIADVKALAPHAITSILFSSPSIDAVQLARAAGATYVHPCWERYEHPSAKLTPEWIARVRQADLGIVIWHEERPDEIAALRQLGVDAICSDTPELLLDQNT